jgi:hypothetical protein
VESAPAPDRAACFYRQPAFRFLFRALNRRGRGFLRRRGFLGVSTGEEQSVTSRDGRSDPPFTVPAPPEILALPPDIRARLNVDETDIGTFAGAVVRLYETEGKGNELVKAGVEGAGETAKAAAAQAEEILGKLKTFQHGLLALSMTGVRTDLALAEKRNAEALAAADELRAALASADAELQRTLALEGAEGFAALEEPEDAEALPPGEEEPESGAEGK